MEQKPKTFNIRNFLSENGRLSSLSLPRDLSLGGSKPKKVYKPNVNVVRNKNKAKDLIQKVQQKRNVRSTPVNKHNNHQPRYVKSAGLFSEGTAEVKRPKIHSDRYLSFRDQDAAMAIPTVVKSSWNIDVKEECKIIEELLAEDEDSSSDLDEQYEPVVLPLQSNKGGFVNKFKVKKEEIEVKKELDVVPSTSKTVVNGYSLINKALTGTNFLHVPLTFREDKIYSEEHPCISLIRMPDSLPGKGYAKDSDDPADYDLSQLHEGKIGKMVIRKSGKIELHIGRTKYMLDSVESSPYKEDLMIIPEQAKSSFGQDVSSLGNVDEKYVWSASWNTLFNQKKEKKK